MVTNSVNKDFNTDILVKKVDLSLLGSVSLKNVEIRDHHKDTLIFVDRLRTSLVNARRILDNKIELKSISLKGVHMNLKTYKGEETDNLSLFVEQIEGEPTPKDSTASTFIMKSSNLYLEDLHFKQIDENDAMPLGFSANNGGGSLQNFLIEGPNVSIGIRGLYFTDNRGIHVTDLTTDFSYQLDKMEFKNTRLVTEHSKLYGDILMEYKRQNLSRFIEMVDVTASFRNSQLSVKDLKKIYNELSGDDVFNFDVDVYGALNNFEATNTKLTSTNGFRLFGDLYFINAISNDKGFIFTSRLDELTADYQKLKDILPNVLGSNLPTEFQRLGEFTVEGITKLTTQNIEATVDIDSQIGDVYIDMEVVNFDNIDTASYTGEVGFDHFNIGKFFENPTLGELTFEGEVDGKGFKIDNINTTLVGKIDAIDVVDYTYKNIDVNGTYQNNLFNGTLKVDDDHLIGTFDGLADLAKDDVRQLDFNADILHADLKAIKIFERDSISVLKGKFDLDVIGSSLENMVGKITIKEASYKNQNKDYKFNQFLILSSVRDSVKTIVVDSEDVIKGELNGKFYFKELLHLVQNALGSNSSNYNPHKTEKDQYLDFNFTVYNQIVDVFLPQVNLGPNTRIKGSLDGDENRLRMTASSPRIVAYGNEILDLVLRTDNKNKLYNSHLTAESISSKHFGLKKLNLLNRNVNDTLFFKSIFKREKDVDADFNLDFFYTINKEKKSVLGIQKSTFSYQENVWNINNNNDSDHKVTFDLDTDEFNFDLFQLISDDQQITFNGSLKSDYQKDIKASFQNVNLGSFLPSIDSLSLKGKLSGDVFIKQTDSIYNPNGSLVIKDFFINDSEQGDMNLDITGKDSYTNYDVNFSIERDAVKSVFATGNIDFTNERPLIDLDVEFKDFGLSAFSPLGQDVVSDLRGTIDGKFTMKGFVRNPDMNGSLTLNNAGLKFPYLNVDYNFVGSPTIDLDTQSFIINPIQLEDVKYNTIGNLQGSITHRNFNDWFLNLGVTTDNLLVLDTEDSEEALYYGTGFIEGNANITGLTNSITIDVNAKTKPNTLFVIPLKDIANVETYKLIHFKSEEKVEDRQEKLAIDAIEGVNLNINLEVTKEAIAQVVIDEVNGSDLRGSGTGDLRIEINTRGKFNMFGDFTIDNGFYDFKYGGVINKPFEILKGGTISWSGNPFEANLDVTAVYTTNANPAVLLENFNTNRKIPVNLITRISGSLFNSTQEFDIEIPNANSTIASELDFVLNDNDLDSKMRQFFSLLIVRSFMDPNKNTFDSGSLISGTTSDVVGSILSDMLSSKDGRFSFGVGYTAGANNDVENLNTDDQVDVSLTTQVSDRVIINGKVGVPVGSQTQSSVVGEVKVEVLLNEEGSFRGVIFNRQNEIQYSTEEEGYTQGIGLSYQVNFNTLSELLQKFGLKKKSKKQKVKKDSIKSKHKQLINFKQQN